MLPVMAASAGTTESSQVRVRHRWRVPRGSAGAGAVACAPASAAWPSHRDERRHLRGGHGPVERVGDGHRTDQDQHDQAHALLAIIRAVREGHPAAGEDQDAADPPRRRRTGLGLLVQLAVFHQRLESEQQQRRAHEADHRGDEQRVADLGGLRPVDAAGAVAPVHQSVGHADADDRTDEGVGGGGGQAQPPGAQVPDDGRDQERKHHGKSGAGADLQDELHRQERDDAERDGATGEQYPEEVERARIQHRDVRLQ
jgi:hypothetical protein